MGHVDRSETFAALDLGTTNCRLLVARAGRDGMQIIDSFSRIVRLGEGLDASGALSEPAMCRALDALRICAAKIGHRRVTHFRFVATEACRRAANGVDFAERVRHATGLELEIIPTGEEARLALAGCAPLLDPDIPRAIVFDIGGGSTELLWVEVERTRTDTAATRIRSVMSLPFGVVSATERWGACESRDAFDRMEAEIRNLFRDFDEEWGIGRAVAQGGVQMLGSSGTVTTLAAMRQGLPRYERRQVDGTRIDRLDILRLRDRIVEMSPAERAAEPCIGAGRADLMLAGCAILSAICDAWPVTTLTVADRGVREGILAGLWASAQARRARHRGRMAPRSAAGYVQPEWVG